MDTLLKATFFIIIGFSLMNFIFSLAFYIKNKIDLYFYQVIFWLSLIINFFIQGNASQGSQEFIIWSYSFSLIPVTLVSEITAKVIGLDFPKKFIYSLHVLSFFATAILLQLPLGFTPQAMPFSLAVAIPLLFVSSSIILFKWGESTLFQKAMGIFLFLNACNSLNFALFRMEPDAQLWGWMTAYALYQALTVILPLISTEYIANQTKKRLRKNIKDKNLELTEANKREELLLRILLHDLSNPTSILGLTVQNALNNLENDSIKELDWKRMVNRQNDAIQMISSIIEQVRDHQAIISGKKKLVKEKIHPTDIKNEIEKQFSEKIKSKGLKINFLGDCLKSDFYIYVDKKSFFNSILSNLISNAIKFSFPYESIDVSLYFKDQSSVFSVKDYGNGIPRDLRDKIFKLGEVTSRLGSEGEKGTGFGLPILKELVEYHGGHIELESQSSSIPGYGFTIFRIYFPLPDNYNDPVLKFDLAKKRA